MSPIGNEKIRIRLRKFIELVVESFKKINPLVDKQKPKKLDPQSPII